MDIFAEVALTSAIAAFLPAKDLLGLHAVSRTLHDNLTNNEELLFHNLLRHDFAEGGCLSNIAKKNDIPRKKMYLAFLNRWSSSNENNGCGEKKKRVSIPWRRPIRDEKNIGNNDMDEVVDNDKLKNDDDATGESGESKIVEGEGNAVLNENDCNDTKANIDHVAAATKKKDYTDDVTSLAFIGRVGSIGNDGRSCVLLKFAEDDEGVTSGNARSSGQRLVLDNETYERAWNANNGNTLPEDFKFSEILRLPTSEDLHSADDVENFLQETHTVTLHVIDVKSCQVMTLMDATATSKYGIEFKSGGKADVYYGGYGSDLPKLYGVPHQGSPYYRNYSDKDFDKFHLCDPYYDDDFPMGIEHLSVEGKLSVDWWRWTGTDDFAIGVGDSGLTFTFGGCEDSSLGRNQSDICSFLRALMKEKCAKGEMMAEAEGHLDGGIIVSQPNWVQIDRVTDSITSYASFEDQAGKLRLVCKAFGKSALKQIKEKLDKTKVIGFTKDCEFGESWFKASVSSGWSDKCLTTKESTVSDALRFASCRCMFSSCNYCDDKVSSDEAKESDGKGFCGDYNGKPIDIDMGKAREKLASKGRVQLTKEDPNDLSYKGDYYHPSNVVQCSFEQKSMTLFEVCNEVDKNIHEHVDGYGYHEGDGESPRLNGYLKRDYKVSRNITSRQFVRTIFLSFVNATDAVVNDDSELESKAKKARPAPIDDVTIAMAKSNITGVKTDHYSRMKKIYRFYTASREQVEICLESKSSSQY